METTKPPIMPSDSDLYNTTDELKTSNAIKTNRMDNTKEGFLARCKVNCKVWWRGGYGGELFFRGWVSFS